MRPGVRPHVSASRPMSARSSHPTRACPNRHAPPRLTRPDPRSILLAASQGIPPACKPARLPNRGAPGASAASRTLRHPPPRKPAVLQVTSGSSTLKPTPMGTVPPAISRGPCLLTRVRRWVRRLSRSLTHVESESRPHNVSPRCSAGASPGPGDTAAVHPVFHSRASGDFAANPPGVDSSSGVPRLGPPVRGSPASVPDHPGRGPCGCCWVPAESSPGSSGPCIGCSLNPGLELAIQSASVKE
jgi:hypothetical protein